MEFRWTRRGLKKCSDCGRHFGQRAKACRHCALRPERSTADRAKVVPTETVDLPDGNTLTMEFFDDAFDDIVFMKEENDGDLSDVCDIIASGPASDRLKILLADGKRKLESATPSASGERGYLEIVSLAFHSEGDKKKTDDLLFLNFDSLCDGTESESETSPNINDSPDRNPHHTIRKTNTAPGAERAGPGFAFQHWLGSVTERINQCMHFQSTAKKHTFTYFIPDDFFECLRSRMSPDPTKQRLPDFFSRDASKNSTKYTWNIANVNQIKRLFDTREIPLEVIQFFQLNADGSFEKVESAERLMAQSKTESVKNGGRSIGIRPGLLVTYLKVGRVQRPPDNPTPFRIEWTPDVQPRSKVGELRLTFQHERSSNFIT